MLGQGYIGLALLCWVLIGESAGAATVDEIRAALARKDFAALPVLAHTAKEAGDRMLATEIARTYKREYLDGLDDVQFFDKEKNRAFVREFAFLFFDEGSQGRVFKYCYLHPKEADAFLDFPGAANGFVRQIITKEQIEDRLWKEGKALTANPDWHALHAAIAKRYPGDYADTLIEPARLDFYERDGNWLKWAKLIDQKIKASPPKAGGGLGDDPWVLNGYAWDAFQLSTNRSALRSALRWVGISITLSPGASVQYIDTKANLLYKLGERAQAIATEETAVQEGINEARRDGKEKGYYLDTLTATIAKMKSGEPTWGAQ